MVDIETKDLKTLKQSSAAFAAKLTQNLPRGTVIKINGYVLSQKNLEKLYRFETNTDMKERENYPLF